MENTNWTEALEPLIQKYKNKKHPLAYESLYQLLVMVVLSAQDSDAHINKIATAFFKSFPNMHALSKANKEDLEPLIGKVRFFDNKANWLLEIATTLKDDKNIPVKMKELTALKGIGRKSANVIMREAEAEAEGIVVDLHVVRVAPRLGIATGKDANKIEQQLMAALPKRMWSEIGMAMSFLGREICRPTNPKHDECLLNKVCAYCQEHKKHN